MSLWQSSVLFQNYRNGMLAVFFLCLLITVQSSSMKDEPENDELFSSSLQARWFNDLGQSLCNQISDFQRGNLQAFDSKVVVQNMIIAVQQELEDANADEATKRVYTETLEEFMVDDDFTGLLAQFEDSLQGDRNIMTIGTDLPELAEEDPQPTKDVGLNGQVLTGETIDHETDLIRYSNYMSGAGTTFGGFMAGLPQDMKDLTTGTMDGLTYKYESLMYKLDGIDNDLAVLRQQNHERMVKYNIEPDVFLHLKRSDTKNLKDLVVTESFDNIKVLEGVSDEKKLLQQSVTIQNKLRQQRSSFSSRRVAGTVLRRIGNGIEASSTAFSFAQGGIDAKAGHDIIKRAKSRKAMGLIGESEYGEMMRNGRLRVAQGSFGVANGLKDVGTFVGKRVEKKLTQKASAAGIELLTGAKRFGATVGSAISVGTSVTSMAKNAMVAKDATDEGNVGKAVMYGVMAAVDGVTAILDGVSLVLDFVFPPLSPIIDLISTILQVINTILGFFADMVDLRSPALRVKQEFEKYICSKGFKAYLKSMEDDYRSQGFDLFVYYIDAEVTGSEADKDILQARKKTITKCLTEKAKEDIDNKELRIALVDATSFGKDLQGNNNDDLILAGFGPDRIYGEEGDDLLFGRGGSDTIYGGPGNDYLNGGTGRDRLFGQEGDDWIDCEPGIDEECNGGPGEDTLALSGESLIFDSSLWHRKFMTMGSENVHSAISGVYLDLKYTSGSGSKGRDGINLGSCFPGWPEGFNSIVHKPAFTPGGALEGSLVSFMNNKHPTELTNLEEIKEKMLWYLAGDDTKYFCDGVSLYSVTESGSAKVARNVIQGIDSSVAIVDENEGRIKYADHKQLEALLVFAFKRSVTLDKFEKFAVQRPRNLEIETNYCPTSVIGSDENNYIDVAYGFNDMVYTGNGNNVVSIGSTLNKYYTSDISADINSYPPRSCCHTWFKYIVGGSGDNTLIIQSMPAPGDQSVYRTNYGYWELRNADSPAKNTYSHVVYLQKIQTVEIHANAGSRYPTSIIVDARNFNGARRYILSLDVNVGSASFFLHGPTTNIHDVTILPKVIFFGNSNNNILLTEGKAHTISFDYYEDETYDIETIDISQEGEVKSPAGRFRSAKLKNVMNVIGFSSCRDIYGNDKANLIMAVGGETTIHARDGDDTLVSARGKNVLIGGSGADTYVLHGPDVVDYLTVTVAKGDDGSTITCKTTIYGEWKSDEGRLYINILKHDHSDVVLNTVEIVPGENSENNQGTIGKDSTNRMLIFEPGKDFDRLERNKAETMRIKITTTGSMAVVKEKDYGNELRFESITALENLVASANEHGLVLKDESNRIVLIDHEWGFKLRKRTLTSINNLIADFALRFPAVLFRQSDDEFLRVNSSTIISFLYSHLEPLVTNLGQDYDTILDSSTLPENIGEEINLGNGENLILAKTKGKTYILGDRASGSVIIAKDFTHGSGEVNIRGRTLYTNLNVVVVDANSNTEVAVRLGPYDLIVTGGLPNEIKVHYDQSGYLHLRNSQNQDFVKLDSDPRRLIFKKAADTYVVFDSNGYLHSRRHDRSFTGITVSYGENRFLRLNCPFTKQQAQINIDGKDPCLVYLSQHNDDLQRYRHPYLTIIGDVDRTIDAKIVANAIRYQFKAGIQFSDGLVANDQLCAFVKENLQSSSGYEILRLSGVSLSNTGFEC